jgi:hypothetical protein
MLRRVMGDTSFFQGLRSWYAGNKDGVGNTAGFQANQEALYGASLDWFFAEWVYGVNRPDYRYGFTSLSLGGGVYRNYVELTQTQVDAGTFAMPVDLTLVTQAGNEVRTVWNDASLQAFVLDTTAPLIDVIVDEDDWILKGLTTSAPPVDGDADAVPDSIDNCLSDRNPLQQDTDGDSAGDDCDDDDDGDQLPDVEDCAPTDAEQGVPPEVTPLAIDRDVMKAQLTWSPAARADTYDVVRGLVTDLGSGYGACHAPGLPDPAYEDAELPPAGAAYFYLVAGRDAGCGGAGPLGENSAGATRPSPCP